MLPQNSNHHHQISMNPTPSEIVVPSGMLSDQVELLAEVRIRKWLLDPTFPTADGHSFVDNHGISDLIVSYRGPSGKVVVIAQDDASSIAARRKIA